MLKKLFLALLLVLAVAAAGLLYLGRQATTLPDWYDPDAVAAGTAEVGDTLAEPVTQTGSGEPARPTSSAESPRATAPSRVETPADVAREVRRELKQEAARDGTLRLDEGELNALLERALASDPDARRVRDATRAVRATFEDDRLVVGAITDLDRLTAAARDAKERAAIGKLKRLAPWIGGREFYLGVEGQPQARDGRLTFDGVSVKVGQLAFDPAQLLALVGLPADRLDRELAVRLPEAELEDVRIEGDVLLLSLTEGQSP